MNVQEPINTAYPEEFLRRDHVGVWGKAPEEQSCAEAGGGTGVYCGRVVRGTVGPGWEGGVSL